MGQHPARETVGVTFTHLLHDLIGLNGRAVTVTASADGNVILACSGAMSGGVDVLEADAGEREALYFPLTGTADGGFLITRRAFTDAAWAGGVLHVELGPLRLSIEPGESVSD
jgi:hypothetical protein